MPSPKRRHCVSMSSAWSGTTAAQRRPRCTGPRHGQCVHVVEVCTTHRSRRKGHVVSSPSDRHAVTISCAWNVTTTAAQRTPHVALVTDTVSVYTSERASTTTVGRRKGTVCVISKRRHAVERSCAWSVTIAAQRRPRCTGPRHGQCVHVVEVCTIEAAERGPLCHLQAPSCCGPFSCAWSGTIAAQRRPIHRRS